MLQMTIFINLLIVLKASQKALKLTRSLSFCVQLGFVQTAIELSSGTKMSVLMPRVPSRGGVLPF